MTAAFAGAGWEVDDHHFQAGFIGKALQLAFSKLVKSLPIPTFKA
jgi:hypothetical protein